MDMVFNTQDLQSATTWITQRLANHAADPINQAALIEPAGEGRLLLATSDGSDNARAVVPIAEGTAEGLTRIGVPGQAFAVAINAARGDKITINVQDAALVIKSTGSKFELPKLDLANHPLGTNALADLPDEKITLTGENLHWTIDTVATAVSNDAATPQLTGIKLDITKITDDTEHVVDGEGDYQIDTAGTDRMLLGVASVRLDTAEEVSLLLPGSVMKGISKNIPKTDAAVKVRWEGDDPSQVYLTLPDRAISVRTLASKTMFPDYGKLLPKTKDLTSRFNVRAEDLRESLKQARLTTADASGSVDFRIDDDGLTLKASTDSMFQYTGTLEANKTGDDDGLQVNLRRLDTAVKAVRGDVITVGIRGTILTVTSDDPNAATFILPGMRPVVS